MFVRRYLKRSKTFNRIVWFVTLVISPGVALGTRILEIFTPPNAKIEPDLCKLCAMCFEPGANKRKCCNALYCDHCYTKDKFCPNCGISTRKEEKSGATFTVSLFSEHEECRVCLEPGLKRRCCGNYYCDDCYYAVEKCRSCQNKVGSRGIGFAHRSEWLPTLLGWLTSLVVIIVFSAFSLTLGASEALTPIGISGYKCEGFFRKCSVSVCVDINSDTADGSAPLPPIHSWLPCELSSTAKLISSGCIFDPTLFQVTEGIMGYDVCEELFEPGIFVFEDTFEHWKNASVSTNQMASALWDTVVNGRPGEACGVASSLGGKNALIFSGANDRFAITKDLDLLAGGYLEAEMLLPPVGWDTTNPLCATNFNGPIDVEYSINQGKDWNLFNRYLPTLWRGEKFFPIRFEIPPDARTTHTRFRFNQPFFAVSLDYWALDNVRVLRYLPNDWQSSPLAQATQQIGNEGMQRAQCCFDTDWCEHRLSPVQMDDCADNYPEWYEGQKYVMRSAELVILLVCFIGIIKFVYVSAQDYLIGHVYPFQAELEQYFNMERFYKYLPARYRPRRNITKYLSDVHSLARLDVYMREHLGEEEGTGDRLKKKAEVKAEKNKKLEKQLKLKNKQLEKRNRLAAMKSNKYAAEHIAEIDRALAQHDEAIQSILAAKTQTVDSMAAAAASASGAVAILSGKATNAKAKKVTIAAEAIADAEELKDDFTDLGKPSGNLTTKPVIDDDDESSLQQQQIDPEKFGTGALIDDVERLKRQNLAALRIPFELRVSYWWTYSFFLCTVGSLTVLFLYQISTCKYYYLFEVVRPANMDQYELMFNSYLFNFFALFCDLKEIYYCIRYVVPIQKKWQQKVTLDRTADVMALFVDRHCIPLSHIESIQLFSKGFSVLCGLGYLVAALPWCILSLVLRNQYLSYPVMRVVTPLLGGLAVARAIVGPALFVKMLFTAYYLLSFNMFTRERIGVACQAQRTTTTALTIAGAFAVLGGFFTLLVAFNWTYYMVLLAFAFGLIYGALAGWVHSLPIRPWLHLTALDGGMYLVVKKKQLCPCIYWGSYCTDMHQFCEVLIFFTEDDVRFINELKGGADVVL